MSGRYPTPGAADSREVARPAESVRSAGSNGGRSLGAAGLPSADVAPPEPEATEIDALAFATDPRSEHALREGLSNLQDAQVWPGDLRAAADALGQGHAPRLVFVDIDGIDYPAGAIYELSTVCEVGTIVVALGSAGTARFTREILLSGVSDYLVKPITAAAVREAAARAAGSAANGSVEGWLVGFAGTGGSGATTLAAATALVAAERGRYVSVLDLDRTFSALSFLLDVEPGGGLVDLLSTVARASLHPEMVEGVRAQRSDRIAVYGYPWSGEPPPLAPVWAVCELLVELQRRSHLVIVDGMDDPATRQTLLAMVDARVLVVEPTVAGAASAARTLARIRPMLDQEWPFLLVQNHTRSFGNGTGARALRHAGVAGVPDVVVPFEPTVPALADRGWPGGRLPRTLSGPLGGLTDRILSMARDEKSAAAVSDPAPPRATPDAPAARVEAPRTGPESARHPRASSMLSVLRRLVPVRTARPRAA